VANGHDYDIVSDGKEGRERSARESCAWRVLIHFSRERAGDGKPIPVNAYETRGSQVVRAGEFN
jgi:hypothetical protein